MMTSTCRHSVFVAARARASAGPIARVGSRRRLPVVGVALASAGVLIWQTSSVGLRTTHTRTAPIHSGAGLALLPAAAGPTVSAALGRENRGYRVRGCRAANPAQGFALKFTSTGAVVRSGASRVSLGVSGFGRRDGRMSPIDPVAPDVSGNVVRYGGTSLREWFANGPLGLEQGFVVARRPAGVGRLVVSVALAGVARVRRDGTGVMLGLPGGSVLRYDDLVALDARGRRLPARLAVANGRVSIVIDDRRAAYPVRIDPLVQQAVLDGSLATGAAEQGYSVALSGDGQTALVGGPQDTANGETNAGAVWVWSLSGSTWSQQAMLVGNCSARFQGECNNQGTGETDNGFDGEFGSSVALSSNGDTALIGAADSSQAWVFTRSGSAWTQQKLLTAPNGETPEFGESVALSSAGTTALIGAPMYSPDGEGTPGAAFVYSSADDWGGTPAELDQGSGGSGFGQTVALSPDGGTALIGGPGEDSDYGEAWVFTAASSWAKQGATLTGSCTSSCAFGSSVALANDGTTALIGGDGGPGKVWVYTGTPGSWTEQTELEGNCLAPATCTNQGTGETGNGGFGRSVAISSDGTDAVIGAGADASSAGAVWEFTESGGAWTQAGAKLIGDCATDCTNQGTGETGAGEFGASVALSGTTGAVLVGAPDNGSPTDDGDAWVFAPPAATRTGTTTTLSGPAGPATVASPVTFTATVAPDPDGGSVTFTAGGTTIPGCGAVSVSNGTAGCAADFTAASAAGEPIIASYSGDTNYAPSFSSALSVIVNPAPTVVTVTASPTPAIAGAPATIKATVSPVPDGGTVRWQDSAGGSLGCADSTVNAAGTATCTTSSFTAAGPVTIAPVYSGDANYESSTGKLTFSPTAPLVIGLAPPEKRATTAATVTSSPCGTTDVTIKVLQQAVAGASSLSVSASGDSTGIQAKLSSSSLPHNGAATLKLTDGGMSSGAAVFTVTAKNPNSTVPATATLTVSHTGLPFAQGLYVTQGTQYDTGTLEPSGLLLSGHYYQGVTLVNGKTTVVRLYADAPGSPAGLTGVAARLYGYSPDGKPLPGSPLSPDYGPSRLPDLNLPLNAFEAVSDQELTSGANAYTFTLPMSWVSGSADAELGAHEIQLVGRASQLDTTASPACEGNDSFTLNGVDFYTVGPAYLSQIPGAHLPEEITPVPMIANGKALPSPSEVFQDSDAVTPLPNGALGDEPYQAKVDISDIVDSCQHSGTLAAAECANQSGYVMGRLESLYPNTDLHIFGVVLQQYGETNAVPGNYTIDGQDFNNKHLDGGGFPGNNNRPLSGVAHELFHQYGLVHASYCMGGGSNGQTAETWPPDQMGYLNGIGLDTTSEPYQFIAPGVSQTLDGSTYSSAHVYDFMSYCAYIGVGDPGDWVSPRNWQQLISNFGISRHGASDQATVASLAKPAADPRAATAQVDPARLSVLGFVTRSGVAITNVGPQVGPAGPSGGSADSFTLTARGASGQVLSTVTMAATTGGHIDPRGGTGRHANASTAEPLVQISAEVPAAGVDSLEVANAGTPVATITRPAKAPRVKVLAPRAGAGVGGRPTVLVRWSATNPEHLPLTAYVDYSTNRGRSWRTIFVGPNTGRVALESFFFTASRAARVRVRISDGFNETLAVSRVFTALGAPPQVTISTALGPKMRFPGDAELQLSGTAVDQAMQTLSGRQLTWYDGPFRLGTGPNISAGPLPAGVNHLRLVARDPAGRTGSAALTVKVSPVSLPFLKLRIPAHASSRATSLPLRGSASISTTITIGTHRFRLSGRPGRFSLPIRRGSAPLLLEIEIKAAGVMTVFAARLDR
jgi:hypothetical protein